MSNNTRKSPSSTAKPQKLFLFPGDPLIQTLKPDYYVIVDPATFEQIQVETKYDDDNPYDPPEPPVNEFEPPNLEDITLVSKKLVTDKNKNQYIEFVFNIKNHVGDAVVGVHGYGQ
jgi:hypothetical protein